MSVKLYQKVPGGKWYCEFYDSRGKRVQKCTKQTEKRVAERVARDLFTQGLIYQPPETPIVSLELGKALAEMIETRSNPGTIDTANRRASALLGFFSLDLQIHTIGTSEILAYLAHRTKGGVSRHSIKGEVGVLLCAMRQAKRTHKLTFDIPEIPKIAFKGAYVPKKDFLRDKERERFLNAMRVRWPKLYPRIVLYLGLGLRRGEILVIRARDVDLEANTVHVAGTKTPLAKRTLPMSDDVRAVLKAACEGKKPDDLLFSKHRDICFAMAKAAKMAEITRTVNVNLLRRTFCSRLLAAGISPAIVARMMGHSGLDLVMSVYGEIDMVTQQEAIKAFNVAKVQVPELKILEGGKA